MLLLLQCRVHTRYHLNYRRFIPMLKKEGSTLKSRIFFFSQYSLFLISLILTKRTLILTAVMLRCSNSVITNLMQWNRLVSQCDVNCMQWKPGASIIGFRAKFLYTSYRSLDLKASHKMPWTICTFSNLQKNISEKCCRVSCQHVPCIVITAMLDYAGCFK